MSDKEALQEIVYMVNYYQWITNNENSLRKGERNSYFIKELIEFLEENVIHCAMDNNYK